MKDAPGFIVNRVARHYYLEAMEIAASGVADPATIDRLLEAAGFRMGPFALMDLIGNDVNYAVTKSLYEAFAEAPRFQTRRHAGGAGGKKATWAVKPAKVFTSIDLHLCLHHNSIDMILVTGGTGFLGSYLLRALVKAGKPVRALYRSRIPDQVQDIADKVEWFQGDVLDVCALEDAFAGITEVYHCAAVVSFQPDKRTEMMKINIEGTANVVNMAIDAGVRKLVHVSSVASLGRARQQDSLSEDSQWEESSNNSQYAISKHLSEMEIWRGIAEGLDAVIVNPSIILGSGFWHDGSGMLLKNAWKEFPYYTEGVNGFVDVEDVVKAMIGLMESPVTKRRFILSGENWPYRQLFTEMARHLGKKPRISPPSPGWRRSYGGSKRYAA